MRHHMDVGLVEVPPDPSMVGSDVKGELPSTHLHLPASQPPVVNLAAPRERDWAVEVGEVEPVRDDSLERRVSLADHSPVRPSIVPASLHAGHRGIAPGRRSTNVTGSPATPTTDRSSILHTTPRSGTHDNSTTPGASSGTSPPTGASCSTIGCPGSLKAYRGKVARPLRRPGAAYSWRYRRTWPLGDEAGSLRSNDRDAHAVSGNLSCSCHPHATSDGQVQD
jgi:hypothetical protein